MKFTGTITLTYNVEADNADDANNALKYIAMRLSDTGIIGASSAGIYNPDDGTFKGAYDARLKRSRPNKARSIK